MSWAIFKINVLNAMKSGKFGTDINEFANFYASEYDKCIKRGGDLLYGVNVINGNTVGMASVIKQALQKGIDSGGENFNLLQEIYPAAFNAYWNGAEMSPFPNPLLRPGGWATTPPAPGTILNIGPNPAILAQSAAKQAAIKAAAAALVDEVKKQTINIPPLGEINVYDTIQKIKKGEISDPKIKKHPAILAAKEIIAKYEQIKKMKPGCGAQFKPSIKFPFPSLPKKQKIIEQATKQLLEAAIPIVTQTFRDAALEAIIQPYVQQAVTIANTVEGAQKPTAEELKQSIKEKINGQIPSKPLPPNMPDLPSAAELENQIKSKIPDKEMIKALAYDTIKSKIPKIPNIWFIPPVPIFTPPTNMMIDPFVNLAKFHLLGTGGTMNTISQYPPPAPPAPAILQWSGYTVVG